MLKSVCTLNKVIYLFTDFWLHRISFAVLGLSPVVVSWGCSLLQCLGFPLQWLLLLCGAQALGVWASVDAVRVLNCCVTHTWLLHHMRNLPRPGIEPLSPALAGGFLTTGLRLLTTGLPEKPLLIFIIIEN